MPADQALLTAYVAALNKELAKQQAEPGLREQLRSVIEKARRDLDELKKAKPAASSTANGLQGPR